MFLFNFKIKNIFEKEQKTTIILGNYFKNTNKTPPIPSRKSEGAIGVVFFLASNWGIESETSDCFPQI